jgi:Co/Zn/Cd efflux system component
MNTFSVNDVFGYVGVVAIGVAGYAWFDGNYNFALASVSVGAFAFYATMANLKEGLAESQRQDQDDSRQRETDDIRNELNKLRNHIDSRVKQTTFDECIREIHQDRENRQRDQSDEFGRLYRHIETEINGVSMKRSK